MATNNRQDDGRRYGPPELEPEQKVIVARFAQLQNLLGRGTRRVGAGATVAVLTPTVDPKTGQLDFGRALPVAAAEVVLFDRSGRIVSVVVKASKQQVVAGHPLAVRFTVQDASGRVLAKGSAPAPASTR